MKNSKWFAAIGVGMTLATLASVVEAAQPVTRRGTSVMHYMTRNDLIGADSNVVGWVRLQHNEQGHSSKQSLQLFASGLETNAPYNLIAIVGEDTNAVPVDEVAVDSKGRAKLNYMTKGKGNGGKNPLPDALTPLTDVRAIGIENASTQTVAHAWIADADKFKVLVKRNLTVEDTNGTAAGSISLIANQRKVNFRLLAGGLSVSNDYQLVLNSDVVSTVAANDDGRVDIRQWPEGAPAILELRTLVLRDGANSNVVLSTTLPK